MWNEQCEFDIINPEVALIRFVLYDEDMFSEANFLGQATYPISCLRQGFRSIQLCNGFTEEIELCSLLVFITLKNPIVSRLSLVTLKIEHSKWPGEKPSSKLLVTPKINTKCYCRNKNKIKHTECPATQKSFVTQEIKQTE